MDLIQTLARELEVRPQQVKAAVELIDEGNTIPFIARYRKEATGSLNDEILRNLHERLTYLRNLEERKVQVRASITEQEKMTPELAAAIEKAETMVALEDIYRPYRPKRRTRATIAVEKGLQPLADLILRQEFAGSLEEEAQKYVSEEKGVASAAEAVSGASDIIAEQISDNAEYRHGIRNHTKRTGVVVTSAKDAEQSSVYEMYYDYQEAVSKIPGHRVLAINRGEQEKILTVKIVVDEEKVNRYLAHNVITRGNPVTTPVLTAAIEDSYKRLIAPAIEREIRNELTEAAEDGAIKVFGKNLEQLLMQPPISGQVVLGWDPAFRTGCKLAVVDETGKVIDTDVIYPTAPTNEKKKADARAVLTKFISKYHVTLISVGNGTASRESEQFIAEYLKTIPAPVQYVITNEAGASVYSASKLATEEFPEFDVGQRSAASIARRVQDPLAELVKIDPKSIGVGQYQHDMNQKKLGTALSGVVENCVNRVGVDLNTASAPLMEYISGISKPIAKNIVAYREENGKFTSRRELLKVPKLGPKAFEQCAGFMRIAGGKEPLDATAVHPEAYEAMKKLIDMLGLNVQNVLEGKENRRLSEIVRQMDQAAKQAGRTGEKTSQAAKQARRTGEKTSQAAELSGGQADQTGSSVQDGAGSAGSMTFGKMAEILGIGEITLRDNIKELMKPGRDPRADMPKPVLRSDVMEMEDLQEGMILKGTVRNVIDFGAFVDIGVHQDGLVHVSQMSSKKFVKHPLEVVSVGDVVEVKVLSVDVKKKRIGLTMKL
ncbi:MAG: RNA-binding transcriptional accessory protein [Eubacterium sp.]|nr:RNA-binding transcriptional accessory protein [Eubacterium sp.]